METYNLRELASTVYYAIYDDLKWYLRRGGRKQKNSFRGHGYVGETDESHHPASQRGSERFRRIGLCIPVVRKQMKKK